MESTLDTREITADMAPRIVLYSSPISECSARLRIAMNLKRLPHETVNMSLKGSQQADTAYMRINPSGTIPTLCINDTILTNSTVALEYLDETFPTDVRLLPDDAGMRAQVRTLASILTTDIHPLLTHRVTRALRTSVPEVDISSWNLHWIHRGLSMFEEQVSGTAGKYCIGDALTLVDVCLLPALWTAETLGADVTQWKTIQRISVNLIELDAFANARQDPSAELDY